MPPILVKKSNLEITKSEVPNRRKIINTQVRKIIRRKIIPFSKKGNYFRQYISTGLKEWIPNYIESEWLKITFKLYMKLKSPPNSSTSIPRIRLRRKPKINQPVLILGLQNTLIIMTELNSKLSGSISFKIGKKTMHVVTLFI